MTAISAGFSRVENETRNADATVPEVSLLRLYVLRAVYLMIFVFVATQFWPAIMHAKPWSLMHGVANCFFAALAPLTLLGIRYPLKMIPVLLFELAWKAIWLLAIGIPLWASHQVDANVYETIKATAMGVVLFPIVIPWRYVVAKLLRERGDRWW